MKKLEGFESIPAILQEPIFEKAFNVAEIANMTHEQYEFYQESLLTYIEVKEFVKTATSEGNEKGRQDREIEIARDLKQLGVAIDIIRKSTGLSEKEINEL